MKTEKQVYEVLSILENTPPESYASLIGNPQFSDLRGMARFYSLWNGSLVVVDVAGLPYEDGACKSKVFGFHLHEGERCLGNEDDPFSQTKAHYNPHNCAHPQHAGDFPPLFENHGYAFQLFYTDRFFPEEVAGKTVVIHHMPDDFKSQPSGDSGMKIACGEIKENKMQRI